MSAANPVMPAPSTPFGARVAQRLRDDIVLWLTTVGADGTPQPNPIWFVWDGESFLIYNLADARRLAHIQRNPRVALHFDGNGKGGDIIVITGEARLSPEDPPASQVPAYLAKYGDRMRREWGSPEGFAAEYSVAIRVQPTKVRGF
jgi:PPOX class probable F420-dependent enzyme